MFGADFQHHLLPLDAVEDEVQVHGLIAKATFHHATRRQQFFFVNGRPVQSRALSRALYEAYRTLLPRDRHPVAFLFLTLPASEVDVNVHPAKLEVRFRQEGRLYDRLRRLLLQRLQASVAGPGVTAPGLPRGAEAETSVVPCRAVPMMWRAPSSGVPTARLQEPWLETPPPLASEPELHLHAGYPELGRLILEGYPLGQLHDTYIVMQYPGGVFFVDQHAAHERVLYERLRARLRDGTVEAQRLLFPATLDLGGTDPEWVASCLPRLEALGFVLEPFGGNTYRLPSVPALLSGRDYAAACMDVLEVLRSPAAEAEILTDGLPQVLHRLLTVMACHGAVRAHQRLQDDEIRALMHSLAGTAMPFTCPHGRPVLLHVGLAEIEKKFLRC
jgi:DNA mismatch repair protein MutL